SACLRCLNTRSAAHRPNKHTWATIRANHPPHPSALPTAPTSHRQKHPKPHPRSLTKSPQAASTSRAPSPAHSAQKLLLPPARSPAASQPLPFFSSLQSQRHQSTAHHRTTIDRKSVV